MEMGDGSLAEPNFPEQLKCILHFGEDTSVINLTDSYHARLRWSASHYIRTKISSDLLDSLNLVRKEDVSREVKPSCIKIDTCQLNKIIQCIKSCKNPFMEPPSNTLHNLSTGRAAKTATQIFLIGVPKMRTQAMNNFIRCCTEDPTAFEKPIKRQKVFTFAEEGVKETKRINGKVKEIQMQRDMCGKLLMLSMKNKIDMKLVCKFPLSIVPLMIAHATYISSPATVVIRSLRGFHSFTGCDQIPAFAGKGKLKPLIVLKSNPAYQKAFASLGSSEMISNDIITELDKFTCEIYGIKRNINADKQPTVNDARYQMFCEKYGSKKEKLSLLKVKGIDGSSLPPSKSALEQQIKRANGLCSVWNHSYSFESQMFSPVGNGWVLHSDKNGERFSLHWFDGDMAPTNLDDILEMQHPEETSNEEDYENDRKLIMIAKKKKLLMRWRKKIDFFLT
ncbi:hypothetical protein DAPPUDRAFT_105253 [Daphnia pulex]|uniref:Uncharacterized protein n=1 Tax=Daphnia pulex TaxID=6669 RepID=E9GPW9_DAPPU|nr:hypothetical protein DAPPUDRAFT_105253 [Daphnia pulex]|eukprot:EFX78456.1 hypothetical protein DAPPUDRAFT_105253 [Daphnia pulex]